MMSTRLLEMDIIIKVYGILVIILASCHLSWSIESLYRVQSNDGRYFAFINDDGQFRVENITEKGNGINSRGSFGWVDDKGTNTEIEFIADEGGYQILRNRKFTVPRKLLAVDYDDPETNEPGYETVDYKYSYGTGDSFRSEERRGNGYVRGKYGYLRPDGKMMIVYYVATKKRGFVAYRRTLDATQYSIKDAKNLELTQEGKRVLSGAPRQRRDVDFDTDDQDVLSNEVLNYVVDKKVPVGKEALRLMNYLKDLDEEKVEDWNYFRRRFSIEKEENDTVHS